MWVGLLSLWWSREEEGQEIATYEVKIEEDNLSVRYDGERSRHDMCNWFLGQFIVWTG